MARNDCPDGILVGGEYEEIVINDGGSCTILGAYVVSGVLVRGGGEFVIKDSYVESGGIRVIDTGNVYIEDNIVEADNIVARDNIQAYVLRNVIRNGGQIRVVDRNCESEDDDQAEVIQNLVFGGGMTVKCHDRAAVVENIVTDGTITCSDNETLISRGNYANKVTCGR
jgi:hypothetical protein